MFISPENMCKIDCSSINSFEKCFIKSKKFQMTTNKHYKITLGVIDTFDKIKKMCIFDFNSKEKIIDFENIKHCIFIYPEKFMVLKNLTIIYPDMNKVYKLMNFHFMALNKYELIKKPIVISSIEEFYDYLSHITFSMKSSFIKQSSSYQSINNDHHISLYPTTDNQMMIGFNIKLPLKKGVTLRLAVIPQTDGTYHYYIKDLRSSSRGLMFKIDQMEECFDYVENLVFKNAYFYKPFCNYFGIREKEEYSPELFKLYEMINI